MTREPAVANQFYPGNKDTLSRDIDRMLSGVPSLKIEGSVTGIAVPHAGYMYSGPTAAYAYKAIAGGDYRTVVILGPSHRAAFSGFAVYAKGTWRTPLGPVPVDEALAAEIIKYDPTCRDLPQAHAQEHSLEVQVPLLQKTLRDFKIVPIEVGEASYGDLKALGATLARVSSGRKVLLLASSDLYHGPSSRECERTDSTTLHLIERFDAQALYDSLDSGSAAACGGAPITVLMLAAKELGADLVQVLHRTNSFAVTGQGEGDWVVGYGAVVFTKGGSGSSIRRNKAADDSEQDGMLNKEEQAELIRIARATVDSYVRTGEAPEFSPLTERLKELRGVFVTLKEDGDLRGCIGYIEGIKPVFEAVRDNAIAAATQDPRFMPVQANELKKIDIEVTVLSPLERCTDPLKDVVAGKHGIVVRQGSRGGVFLPQVATETGWDVETFLSQCCSQKAGLPANAWKDKRTEVYRFSGQVFGEKK